MKMNRKFILVSCFAILASAAAIAEDGNLEHIPATHSAVLYEFANVTDLSTLAEGPVKETCSHYAAASANTSPSKTKPLTHDEAVKFADSVNKELAKKLLKEVSVSVAQPADIPSAGSLVFTGCFIGANRGNAAGRLVGFGVGSSHLSAHIRVFYVGASGSVPVDEFNLTVKGSHKLPPLGPAGLTYSAVSEKWETLNVDAKRMADQTLKKLNKDHRVVQSDDGLLVEAKAQ